MKCKNCTHQTPVISNLSTQMVCSFCGTINWIDPKEEPEKNISGTMKGSPSYFKLGEEFKINNKIVKLIGHVRWLGKDTEVNLYQAANSHNEPFVLYLKGNAWFRVEPKDIHVFNHIEALLPAVGRYFIPNEASGLKTEFFLTSRTGFNNFECVGENYFPQFFKRNITIFEAIGSDNKPYLLFYDKNVRLAIWPLSAENIEIPPQHIKPVTVACVECHAEVKVLNPLGNHFAICFTCQTAFHIHNHENYGKAKYPKRQFDPLWNVGTTGVLNGKEWIITGVIKRKETGADYYWYEYYLQNSSGEEAFVSEYEGNWIFLEPYKEFPPFEEKVHFVDHKDIVYNLFLRYKTTAVKGVGEFTFPPLDKDIKLIKEYIKPPVMLMSKAYENEHYWLKGKHIKFKTLEKAFGVTSRIPDKVGIGSIQPVFPGIEPYDLFKLFGITLVLLGLIQISFTLLKIPKTVFEYSTTLDPEDKSKGVFISPNFFMDGWMDNVEVSFSTDLSMDWVEIEANLVNVETGEEYSLTKEMAYYTGIDDGYEWSEGNNKDNEILSSIPGGNYYLSIVPYKSQSNKPVKLHMEIRRGVPMNTNFYWLLGFLLVVGYGLYFLIIYNEKKRWNNSNYIPAFLKNAYYD